ncbi:MAG: hypothetical protein ACSHX4_10870 [Opitutaceae bacterium]
MTDENHITVDKDTDYYENLYHILPGHIPSRALSLSDYDQSIFEWLDEGMTKYQPIPPLAIELLDHLPKLKDNLRQRDSLEITFGAHGCQIPNGLGELPVIFAEPMINFMDDINWRFIHGTCQEAVFSWESVKQFKESIEITFPCTIPHTEYDWEATARILLELHHEIKGAVHRKWQTCKAKN